MTSTKRAHMVAWAISLRGSYLFLQTKSTSDLWEWSNSSSFMSAKLSWRFLSFPHSNLKMAWQLHSLVWGVTGSASCLFEAIQHRCFRSNSPHLIHHLQKILKFVCCNGERLTEYIKSIPMYNSAVPRNGYNKWSHLSFFFFFLHGQTSNDHSRPRCPFFGHLVRCPKKGLLVWVELQVDASLLVSAV